MPVLKFVLGQTLVFWQWITDLHLSTSHPAMFDDAFTVLKYMIEDYTVTVILSDDSAGENLARSITHAAGLLS